MQTRMIVVCPLLLTASILARAGDLAVIVHTTNPLRDVSVTDLAKICKGQQATWPDDTPVIVAIKRPASPEMKIVLKKIYGMRPEEVESRLASVSRMTGPHARIVLLDSDPALIKMVETTPGALGIVDVYAITERITVVKVNGKLPFQPGYLLHRK